MAAAAGAPGQCLGRVHADRAAAFEVESARTQQAFFIIERDVQRTIAADWIVTDQPQYAIDGIADRCLSPGEPGLAFRRKHVRVVERDIDRSAETVFRQRPVYELMIDAGRCVAVKRCGTNRERRDIEDKVLNQALDQMASVMEASGAVAFVAREGWHPGVLGIVASRLKDRFNRPACVLGVDDHGLLATGSGRSVSGVDLGAAVIAAHQAGIIETGGGHRMAAGFTLAHARIDDFRDFLNERIGTEIAEAGIKPTLRLDGTLTAAGAGIDVAETLQQLGPFGSGNAEPRFAVPSARIAFADRVGEDHVRCTLESPEGGKLQGICFRSTDRPLGQGLLTTEGRPMHVAGRVRVNTWQGRSSAQLMIDDAQPAW